MRTTYYDGPGLGIHGLGQAAEALSPSSPVTLTIRPTGALIGAWWSLSTLSGVFSAYHGYKRNSDSLGWALAWFLMGSALPIIVPAYAVLGQGYAKPAMSRNKRRSRRSRR